MQNSLTFLLLCQLCLSFVWGLFTQIEANSQFDPTPAWPLCGRIVEHPPAGWIPRHGCPAVRWGNPNYTDAPFSSTFGPRQKASEQYRYDYHRGLDIPTAVGTPVFAIADGMVTKAGLDLAYTDALVQIRHYRPGYWRDCKAGGGCYVSQYLHLKSWTVAVGTIVTKGQFIGYTGLSVSGFAHLHFEIRNAPGPHDPLSAWQRDAIHPLQVLPYYDTGTANLRVTIDRVEVTVPLKPQVTVAVTLPNKAELDLQRVEVAVYQVRTDRTLRPVVQAGNTATGRTPEGTGYNVAPPWFDMGVWNRQYSYKDSVLYPWQSFQRGGVYQSPYWSGLPALYDANIHLDRQAPNNRSLGHFNGVTIAPARFHARSTHYKLAVTFHELTGVANPQTLCIKARAQDARGKTTAWVSYKCP